MDTIFNKLLENFKGTTDFSEPDSVSEAIELHTTRLKLLEEMRQKGFETISEYQKYIDALEIVSKYGFALIIFFVLHFFL